MNATPPAIDASEKQAGPSYAELMSAKCGEAAAAARAESMEKSHGQLESILLKQVEHAQNGQAMMANMMLQQQFVTAVTGGGQVDDRIVNGAIEGVGGHGAHPLRKKARAEEMPPSSSIVRLPILVEQIKSDLGLKEHMTLKDAVDKAVELLGIECTADATLKQRANEVAEELGLDKRA